MKVKNARRLTGRGFFAPCAGAVVELWLEPGEDHGALEREWNGEALRDLLPRIGLAHAERFEHTRQTGLTSAIRVPIDRLLAVANALEWAALALAKATDVPLEAALATFRDELAAEENAALLALEAAAHERGAPFLWDDQEVSLGLGPSAEVFPARALPALAAIDWARYRAIPVGMVTGTNGKTTTTRMVARILAAAGHVAGMSSTDAITIDGEVVEEGDWTGPGAARKVLRDRRVTAAVLETARGGILRRGLAYEAADAAVVTNIGEDHFGDYGITRLDDMARVKAVVWEGVRAGGTRIANAGDPVSVAHLDTIDAIGEPGWVMFTRAASATFERHVAAGGEGWTVREGHLVHLLKDGEVVDVIALADAPSTFGGAAAHNVENALAAAALAHALGVEHAHIAAGLASFGRVPSDNAGRLELHELPRARVLLDFGHNPHGVLALAPIAAHLRAQAPGQARLLVVTGQAGDRSDHDLAELARAILTLAPEHVLVRPVLGYERGRAPGEVEAVLSAALLQQGLDQASLGAAADEVDALEQALRWAWPGDIVLVLAHIQRAEVQAWLAARTSAKTTPTAP